MCTVVVLWQHKQMVCEYTVQGFCCWSRNKITVKPWQILCSLLSQRSREDDVIRGPKPEAVSTPVKNTDEAVKVVEEPVSAVVEEGTEKQAPPLPGLLMTIIDLEAVLFQGHFCWEGFHS